MKKIDTDNEKPLLTKKGKIAKKPEMLGNKLAKGCTTSGRPRTHDLIEEAKAFREWADKPDSLILRLFSAIRGYSGQEKLHEYASMCSEFREAFNYARVVIGARREKMLLEGKGNPAPFHRYAALYDKELKEHDLEMKRAQNPQTDTSSPIVLIDKGQMDAPKSKGD